MKRIVHEIGHKNATLCCYLHEDMVALGCDGEYRKKRPAMLVIPGGGYQYCSEREKDPVALRFFALGYETFTLTYSCKDDIVISNPEEEAAEALRIIRSYDSVDGSKVAGIGFSAGANLLGNIAAHGKLYADDIVLNAIIMSYPVVSSDYMSLSRSIDTISCHDKSKYDYYSIDRNVGPDFPPTFIWSTTTDGYVDIMNSLLLYDAVRKQKVKVEMHIYAEGEHGLSVATTESGQPSERVSHWFDEAVSFLSETLDISDYRL